MSNQPEADPAVAAHSATPAVTEPPKPAEKPAPKVRPTKAAEQSTQEGPSANKTRRRIIWSCIGGYLLANFLMFLRFFFPRALFEPSTVFKVGYPSDFQLGVSDKFKQLARLYVVKEPTRIFCIFAKCTHLACTPDWKPAENKFKCPCHGSGYTPEGINFEGPAPRPMDRAHVELDAQGQIVVDTSRLYTWDRAHGGADHFDDSGAYIPI